MLQKQNEAILLPVMIIATALSIAKKVYDDNMTVAGKACQGKMGYDLDSCVRRVKTKALSAKITSLKAEMVKCNKTDKPDKCRKMFIKHIHKIQKQIQKISFAKRRLEMDTNRMKLGLIYIFSESNKLSSKAKLGVIKFIEMADEHQLKVLAMDGEFINSKKLDEDAREIIDARFKVSEIAPLVFGAAVGALTWATSRYQARKTKKNGGDA